MSPGSSTESYPAFAHIGLRENPGKNLNQVTCPDRESNPGHLVSRPGVLAVTPQFLTHSLRSSLTVPLLIGLKEERAMIHCQHGVRDDEEVLPLLLTHEEGFGIQPPKYLILAYLIVPARAQQLAYLQGLALLQRRSFERRPRRGEERDEGTTKGGEGEAGGGDAEVRREAEKGEGEAKVRRETEEGREAEEGREGEAEIRETEEGKEAEEGREGEEKKEKHKDEKQKKKHENEKQKEKQKVEEKQKEEENQKQKKEEEQNQEKEEKQKQERKNKKQKEKLKEKKRKKKEKQNYKKEKEGRWRSRKRSRGRRKVEKAYEKRSRE
ncbi:hypothetical protein ANN_18607 [Periplaneta americana]|uniref:Uncharacterized protein n=1 Tax=Periplaneta americana TaxID=6978 RepID=A0ABQ8SPP7_PERAM|nr:hypothetical protein ANN_18607 [Periplaneta americana]